MTPNLSEPEIARFDALAADWWNPAGPMRALHAMNTLRVDWIARRLPAPARLLDVGCGAGLAAEALARLGHEVLGLDASPAAIQAARGHAAAGEVDLRYRQGTVEDLIAEGSRFPAITALEVIEHVPDPAAFLRDLSRLLLPGGRLFLSTLNRSLLSLALAKIGAEYIVRLLPPGTHQWRQFITPAELRGHAAAAGLRIADTAGLRFNPITRAWAESRDLRINYIAEIRN